MSSFLTKIMQCPFCSGTFDVDGNTNTGDGESFGILRCFCREYPIISGIPVIKYYAGEKERNRIETILAFLKDEKYNEALMLMLAAPIRGKKRTISRFKRLMRKFGYKFHLDDNTKEIDEKLANYIINKDRRNVTALDFFHYYFIGSRLNWKEAYNYFAYRFGQPRHLVALSLTNILENIEKPILEIACGFGHITHSLVNRSFNTEIVALDQEYFLTYIAKNFLAPQANFICCDANYPLPFSDGIFSSIVCFDGIHYIYNKSGLISEAKRVSDDRSVFIFGSSRNGLLEYPYAGFPLPPDGYKHLVRDLPHSIVGDNDILNSYFKKRKPDLSFTGHQPVDKEPLLSIIASKNKNIFRDFGRYSTWPHSIGTLTINPLYKKDRTDDDKISVYKRQFPSKFYLQDNIECLEYLPEEIALDSSIMHDLAVGKHTDSIDRAIENFVVFGIPENYC